MKDQTQVANTFANYFSSIASEIGDARTLQLTKDQLKDNPSVQVIENHKNVVNGPQFEFAEIFKAEVLEVLRDVNPRKRLSMGYDMIPPKVLKMTSDALVPSLTAIFNKCFRDNEWPLQWKKGLWIPIFKKDNHLDTNNYRPITALSAIGKVFEQLIS